MMRPIRPTLLTLPVLLAALIYLFADHRFGARTTIEANGWGGNAIYPWVRFALSQPMSFIYAIPVLGFVAEVVPTFARRRTVLRVGVLVGVGIFATASLTGATQITHGIRPMSQSDGAERFRDIVAKENAEIIIANHTLFDGSKRNLPLLKTRKPGDQNPYVIGDRKSTRLNSSH